MVREEACDRQSKRVSLSTAAPITLTDSFLPYVGYITIALVCSVMRSIMQVKLTSRTTFLSSNMLY